MAKNQNKAPKAPKTDAEGNPVEKGPRKPRELQPLTVATRAFSSATREQARLSVRLKALREELAEAEGQYTHATSAAEQARQELNALTSTPAEA